MVPKPASDDRTMLLHSHDTNPPSSHRCAGTLRLNALANRQRDQDVGLHSETIGRYPNPWEKNLQPAWVSRLPAEAPYNNGDNKRCLRPLCGALWPTMQLADQAGCTSARGPLWAAPTQPCDACQIPGPLPHQKKRRP